MEYLVEEKRAWVGGWSGPAHDCPRAHTHAKSDTIAHLHTAPHNASGRFCLIISMAALLFYWKTRGNGCGEGEMIPNNKALPACLSLNVSWICRDEEQQLCFSCVDTFSSHRQYFIFLIFLFYVWSLERTWTGMRSLPSRTFWNASWWRGTAKRVETRTPAPRRQQIS